MDTDELRVEPSFNGALPPPLPIVRYKPEFNGKAGEFFGIWIVNLVLTVLTLGIYSAWAKVRTQRYFYANTRLAGASFEYLANPLTILKGRLIAYAVLLTLTICLKLQVFWVVIPLYLLIIAVFPLLIRMSLRFRARYSAWRGLRFRFDGTTGDAYGVYMGYPILAVFTLYLLVPWVHLQQQAYLVGNHRYGDQKFQFKGEAGAYYRPFWIVLGLSLVAMVLFGTTIAIAMAGAGVSTGRGAALPAGFTAMVIVFYALMLALPIYLRTKWLNLMWNNASLGPHRFESTLQARQVIWLYLSNGICILLSLGLAVPWAMVRMMRYRVSQMTLIAEGSLDDFVAMTGAAQSAAASEFIGALDMDLDIAL